MAVLDAWWQDSALMPLQRDGVLPQPAGSATSAFPEWSRDDAPGSVGSSVATRDGGVLVGHVTLRAPGCEEGRRREVALHGGHFQDEVLLAVLEPEWRAAHA